MEGVVEFYVTCNPPLLPNGVSQMIAYATDDFVQVSTGEDLSEQALTLNLAWKSL